MSNTRRACGLGLAVLATLGPAAAASAASSPVLSCGQTITTSVRLTQDLRDCPNDGLVVGASDITIDLNGHAITGTHPTDYDGYDCRCAINDLAGYDRVTVRSGRIEGFMDGADFVGARGVVVSGLASTGHYVDGIYFKDSSDSRISQSTFSDSYRGVNSSDSRGLTISDNRVHDIEHSSIALFRVTDSVVRDNTVLQSTDWGIEVVNSSRMTIQRNKLRGWGADGIGIIGMTQFGGLPAVANAVLDNELRAGSTAIEVIEVDGGTVKNTLVAHNDIRETSDIGILVDAATTRDGSGYPPYDYTLGIGPSESRIVDNLAARNALDGIRIDSPGNLLARNVSQANAEWGIFAVDQTTDGGGNRARANGQPEQCSGVSCTR
jgi:parallel beta-helix repeat protein